jgi:signal transduction histidine kinase
MVGGAEKTVLFRVAQEALTNVVRHAQATKIRLGVEKVGDTIQMEIRDNGKSFEVEKTFMAKNSKRLGLIGMRERMEMVGGGLAIVSNSRKGTTVTASIPFKSEKIKR